MKKKLISAAFVVAIALTAGYNVYNSQNKVALSDLALDNVEALASGESDSGPDWNGFERVHRDNGDCCRRSSWGTVCAGYLPTCD